MSIFTIPDVKTLDERIQSLPQELQDWIKELVVANGLPAGRLMLDRAYKPPLGLQIDHKTRERFAKELYKGGVATDVTKFIDHAGTRDTFYELTGRWLNALSIPHRELVETFLFDTTGGDWEKLMGLIPARLECCWARRGIKVQHGLVAIKFNEMKADGTYVEKTFWEVPKC